MKYNLTALMTDHRGNDMKEGDQQLSLGLMLERACMHANSQDDTVAEKFSQYKLAQRIARLSEPGSELIDLSSEDVTLLKKLTGTVYTSIACGAVCEALENPIVDSAPEAVVETLPAAEDLIGAGAG